MFRRHCGGFPLSAPPARRCRASAGRRGSIFLKRRLPARSHRLPRFSSSLQRPLRGLRQGVDTDLKQILQKGADQEEGQVEDGSAYVGRTYRDAPDVDGYIFINTDESFMTGDIVKVKVTGAYEYDLIGEVCN